MRAVSPVAVAPVSATTGEITAPGPAGGWAATQVASSPDSKRYTALPVASSSRAVSWAATRAISSRSPSRATTVATRRRAACSASRSMRSVTSVHETITCPTRRSGPGSGSSRALYQRGPSGATRRKSSERGSPDANTACTASSQRPAISSPRPSAPTCRPRKAPAVLPVTRSISRLTKVTRRSESMRAMRSAESSTSARKAAFSPLSRSSACLRAVMSLARIFTLASPPSSPGSPSGPGSGTSRRCSQRTPSMVGISSSRWRSLPPSTAAASSRSSGSTTSDGSPASVEVRPRSASTGRPSRARAASLAPRWRKSPSSSITIGPAFTAFMRESLTTRPVPRYSPKPCLSGGRRYEELDPQRPPLWLYPNTLPTSRQK